jgi:hypothetical protein
MKKISLAFLACFFSIVGISAQNQAENPPTASTYEERKLKVEEIDLVGSYYTQDGNNSAVTGGIGTEKLSDFSNTLTINLSKLNKKNIKHRFGVEMGFDSYTSASSDMIDPNTITSPSYTDQRYYPSLFWSRENAKTGNTFGASVAYSQEWDYKSYGAGIAYSKSFNENNSTFALKANVFLDKWWMIFPDELRPDGYPSGTRRYFDDLTINPRNTFNLSLLFSQIINERLQIALIVEPNFQKGQLATPYQRVYFTTADSVRVEKLPEQRWKIPLGLRANYFIGDRLISRNFYRYYQDEWGLKSHTINSELAIKLNPFVTISPNYRFYVQNAAQYFAPYAQHNLNDTFYTSDYDLSKFHSHTLGMALRWKPLNGILGMKHFSMIEIKYAYYNRSTALSSNIIALQLQFK